MTRIYESQPFGSAIANFALIVLILQGISAGFIDMDTPLDKRTTTSLVDGTVYDLVMSDEFNTPNRTFTDGHDPMWTALDKPDIDSSSAGGGSQQFYNSSMVTTENGMLKIQTKIGKTTWDRYDNLKKKWSTETAYYLSGMVQSWEKFCFTGGIIEVDVILPGEPYVGGLWPAVWMLGNLGRATYEASTNNIWPWSYDVCDRKKQDPQAISACNNQNHYGMNPRQGRGATEIDIIEMMSGDSGGPLPSTNPPIELPYVDMTLQLAPGVTTNRPPEGLAPRYTKVYASNGHVIYNENVWYRGIEFQGNTSVNPFFYGTYLGETKPGEPVTRTKKQAFQADAIGAAHQLTPSHFNRAHTFRVEWQPGRGGRIDWFVQGHRINETFVMEGDGLGKDWVRAYTITDDILNRTTGAQIPIEPTYLIFNTAVSSTWGFPYNTPDWCKKCYDCDDPKCACTFSPGFCEMLRDTDVALYIDSIRVYQSKDPSAHVGAEHTLGCDPPEFPTRGWIKGHEYRYMRDAPFSNEDKHPLRQVQKGGGKCKEDEECGAYIKNINLTEVYENGASTDRDLGQEPLMGRGTCVEVSEFHGYFSAPLPISKVCKCNPGFTGPHCLAEDHIDDTPSSYKMHMSNQFLTSIPEFRVTPFMGIMFSLLAIQTIAVACFITRQKRMTKRGKVTRLAPRT